MRDLHLHVPLASGSNYQMMWVLKKILMAVHLALIYPMAQVNRYSIQLNLNQG